MIRFPTWKWNLIRWLSFLLLSNCLQTKNENLYETDDWSQECLKHLFNKKIWLPDFVRWKNYNKIIFLKFQFQQRFFILIPLLLPIIDVLTDHIFAIFNALKYKSPALAAIGWALLWNLLFGPMLFGKSSILKFSVSKA